MRAPAFTALPAFMKHRTLPHYHLDHHSYHHHEPLRNLQHSRLTSSEN